MKTLLLKLEQQSKANAARLEAEMTQGRADMSRKLHARLEGMLTQISELRLRGFSVFTRWTVGVGLGLVVVGFIAKDRIYKQVGKEAAEMATHALEQQRLIERAVAAVNAVAKDPDTLASLVALLEQLLRDPSTRKALIELLVWAFQQKEVISNLVSLLQYVFSDPSLRAATGEFLMKSLDDPEAKEMLHAQTAALVQATVLDEAVQRDAGTGLSAAGLCAVTPRFLTRAWWSRDTQ